VAFSSFIVVSLQLCKTPKSIYLPLSALLLPHSSLDVNKGCTLTSVRVSRASPNPNAIIEFYVTLDIMGLDINIYNKE